MRIKRNAHGGIVGAMGLVACLVVGGGARELEPTFDVQGPAGLMVGDTLTVPARVTFAQRGQASQGGSPEGQTARTEARRPETIKVEVPVVPARWGDSPEMRGARHFMRRCLHCHRGLYTKGDQRPPYGISLAGVLKDAAPDREAFIRDFIQQGSPNNMPGYRDTFTPQEFDDLIAFLRTLEEDPR